MKMINDPCNYKLNNIVFRISSSKVLEQFKNMQSFILSEVQFGKYHFSKVAKELALLYTDSAFKILLLIEQLLVRSGKEKVDEDIGYKIIKIMLNQADYMISVVNHNDCVFDKDFVRIWKKIHLPIAKLIERVVEQSVNDPIDVAFSNIGAIMIDSIDTVRFELYELDYMINNRKKPFLVITELCAPILRYLGKNLPEERANAYYEEFGADIEFKLQNYTDSYATFISCAEKLSEKGLKITNFKREFDNESGNT